MKRVHISALFAAAMMVSPMAIAQEEPDWSPTDYAGVDALIAYGADEMEFEVYETSIFADAFDTSAETGAISFLKEVEPATSYNGAPEGLKLAYVERDFIRDQMVQTDTDYDWDGVPDPRPYRSWQAMYVVDCDAGTLVMDGETYFQKNNTEGRAVMAIWGVSDFSKLELRAPEADTHEVALMARVCSGA